jgi:hypothetical protein
MAENKIEQYLIDLKYSYREVKTNFWLLDEVDQTLEGMAIVYADPIVIFRIQVMNAPGQNREEFFKKILELNASDMIHGAYGLEGEKVVISASLEFESLNYEEFRATLDAIGLALAQHYPILSVYREDPISKET